MVFGGLPHDLREYYKLKDVVKFSDDLVMVTMWKKEQSKSPIRRMVYKKAFTRPCAKQPR